MNPLVIAGQVIGIIDKFIPDPAAKAKALQELAALEGELAMKQMDVNIAEASHQSVFVAGWRPAIGWVCGLAFAYSFILRDFLMVGGKAFFGIDPNTVPPIDNASLMTVLLGILGLGAMRTYEKVKT